MFRAGSSDRWTWSMDVERSVDFCVHALRRDGLRVAPFDQHREGDSGLRARGLDPESWWTWLMRVLDAHGRLRALSSTANLSEVDRQQITEAFDAFSAPASLCPGSTELRARLEALWAEYEPTGQQWEYSLTGGPTGRMSPLLTRPARQIWKGLLPYHERLATLQVYLVDYPAPAVLTIPPLTCVIAATDDRGGFAGQVISAAETLAAR